MDLAALGIVGLLILAVLSFVIWSLIRSGRDQERVEQAEVALKETKAAKIQREKKEHEVASTDRADLIARLRESERDGR